MKTVLVQCVCFLIKNWSLTDEYFFFILSNLPFDEKETRDDVHKIQPHEIQSTEFYWDDLVLGFYVVSLLTKKKKNVLLLSTCKPILA